MKKIIIILGIFIFLPAFVDGATASDFKINNQPIYVVPPGTSQVLILDLTLPEFLKSIKIINAGTAQQWDISKISIFEDGISAGWDGDEKEVVNRSSSPFWDTWLSGDFSSSQKRIFVTMDLSSAAASERTIKPQLQLNSVEFASGDSGPSDQTITGFERMILAGASYPTVPVAPLAKTGEALSTSTIRWYFTDLSNNEFGFKIKDSSLKTVAISETANLSYLEETGLEPNTEYSGRRAVTYNDRGEGPTSAIFPAVTTLVEAPPIAEEVPEEVPAEEEVAEETPAEKPISAMTAEELKTKILEIQQKIIELLKQLIQLIQQQIIELTR